jgi:micrococcal nuclease
MFEYRAKVLRVVDGDTFEAVVDLGFDQFLGNESQKRPPKFRMAGIDAPEKRGESRTAGLASMNRLKELIEGKWVVIRTEKSPEHEKYGRWLATVFVNDINVNELLLEEGLAVKFMA